MDFKDKMEIGDKPVEVGLRCAKCGVLVHGNRKHLCGYKTNSSASSGVEMYIPIRSKKDEK
jgi:hypothetical protein